ncbi:YhcN/YlaJ family sporulation lipoprotein [Mesobacillus jeotgali]|jgi:YhcN/YlaJ family sporulation lipoprotein|uniref:YhcN/YlaJ family sporulation lipoprotein n=1 Tax=Mesobacillus jeotgali TaxID=129985 RepID=A0ABY9VLB6_9BACI|nr:YhcN/YlaJ family sporulation lipoprotein [Mesobacillus jeotgali]WNF24338.1 YhcN/YlaJ family sporulation lipoprotein [Mesobacillus jeotgali]
MKRLVAAISFVLLLTACNGQNNANEAEDDHKVKVQNSAIEEVDRQSGQKISRHLVDLTTHIPNVDDAAAVVVGRYAIVGIDVNDNMERSEVDTVKYTVAEALKKDPHGARAVVVADPDITARLREISEDIQNGQPIQGIMNELSDITGRMMPEVPADMIEPQTNSPTEDPKKNLNDGEQNELEKKQEKQSNYHK